jgi:hypothetical protein
MNLKKTSPKARGDGALRQNRRNSRLDEDYTAKDTISLLPHLIRPPKVLVRLPFRKTGTMISVGGATTSISFTPNGIYDVDTTVASSKCTGFDEWIALYGVYRVIKCHVKVDVINYEAFPFTVACGFFPFVIAAGAFTQDKYQNKFCKETILSPSLGIDHGIFDQAVTMRNLFGISTVGDLQQFYGTGASNPSTAGTWCLGCISPTGAVMTAGKGVVYDIRMWFDVEFSFPTTLDY